MFFRVDWTNALLEYASASDVGKGIIIKEFNELFQLLATKGEKHKKLSLAGFLLCLLKMIYNIPCTVKKEPDFSRTKILLC